MEVTYRVQEGYRLPNLMMPHKSRRSTWASTRSCGDST